MILFPSNHVEFFTMKLTIFIGSPRNKKSNSRILINQFLEGFSRVDHSEVDIHFLANIKKLEEHTAAFSRAETVLIIFPLYTDCMPGIVKLFFESIAKHGNNKYKRLGFIVQSGFPESVHSVYIENYLERLTQRLGCQYIGTIVKGGVEGIQIMPKYMTKKLFNDFSLLGEGFARNGTFSEQIAKKMRKPFKMSIFNIFILRLMSKLGFANFYWNMNLKKNKAYHLRFAKPYSC